MVLFLQITLNPGRPRLEWEVLGRDEEQSEEVAGTTAVKPEHTTEGRRQPDSSGDESDAKPPRKKTKAAVKQTKGVSSPEPAARQHEPPTCFSCGEVGYMSSRCPTGPKCFACNKYGHIARDCTDKEAKKRNDEYMRNREEKPKPAEN
ncbi:hypothetical protein PInf_007196 [Phytophthora infestans]|nr:hypothetical protein PInf_007196 [Phytophthora infestans]